MLHASEDNNKMELGFSSGRNGSLGNLKFDQDTIKRNLVKMIIIDELSFRFVEVKEYNKHMKGACPRFYISLRWTVVRDCYKVYAKEKTHMKNFLRSYLGRMSHHKHMNFGINN